MSSIGPISLGAARRAADVLRLRLEELALAIAAAERWRRAAGWDDPEAADGHAGRLPHDKLH